MNISARLQVGRTIIHIKTDGHISVDLSSQQRVDQFRS